MAPVMLVNITEDKNRVKENTLGLMEAIMKVIGLKI